MRAERIIPAIHGRPAHFESAWWAGFNDLRGGHTFDASFATVTDNYEYTRGFHAAERRVSTGRRREDQR